MLYRHILVSLIIPLSAFAQGVIFSTSVWEDHGFYTANPADNLGARVRVGFGSPPMTPDSEFLFYDIFLSESSVGGVFIKDANSNDPLYDQFVGKITDGIDEVINFSLVSNMGYGMTGGMLESQFFSTLGRPDADLVGFDISQVKIIINDLTIESPGSDPNNDGKWVSMSGNVTLEIVGQSVVPEPSTYALFLGGIALFATFTKRSRTMR